MIVNSEDLTEKGPAIVRDCWSRVMKAVDEKFRYSPGDVNQVDTDTTFKIQSFHPERPTSLSD
ncbi:unnamed protein product [Anisakis simplex]|uniref:PRELI/MSF1 domain-containing protein n=1 Tax=Anisakis simplex TaxID=6269 RepID=A0A0M3JM17_ANISI|nr:unnamed protein product [Anisakis simplex]